MKRKFATCWVVVCAFMLARGTAHADTLHAHYSGKRLLVEILGGELVGGVATALTFRGVCDGTDCFGSAMLAFGANVAVTPLAVWSIGKAMGGDGSLGYAYLGSSIALAPFGVSGSPDETPADALSRIEIEVAISSILLAPCSALAYEATSQLSWAREHSVTVGVQPVHDQRNVTGAMGMFSARW
jgi:hypothetical protein